MDQVVGRRKTERKRERKRKREREREREQPPSADQRKRIRRSGLLLIRSASCDAVIIRQGHSSVDRSLLDSPRKMHDLRTRVDSAIVSVSLSFIDLDSVVRSLRDYRRQTRLNFQQRRQRWQLFPIRISASETRAYIFVRMHKSLDLGKIYLAEESGIYSFSFLFHFLLWPLPPRGPLITRLFVVLLRPLVSHRLRVRGAYMHT